MHPFRIQTTLALLITSTFHVHATPVYIAAGTSHTDIGQPDDIMSNKDDYRHGYRYELTGGLQLRPNISIDGNIYFSPPTQDEDRPEINGVRAAGVYFFRESFLLRPFLSAGLAYESLSESSNDFTLPSHVTLLSLGAGLQYDFTSQLFGRAEIRRGESIGDELRRTDYQVSIGYRFGSHSPTFPSHQTAVVTTPAPEVPTPAPVASPAIVIAPSDSDKDGVLNAKDDCPASPPNSVVNKSGCPIFDAAIKGVTFKTNSSRLTEASKKILDKVASDLLLIPDVRIEIQAHTDDRGPEDYNQQLSQRRAESVLVYLINHGVPDKSLEAKGYGETHPKASNDTLMGRAENRRVELHPLNQQPLINK
jgi:OOP family OmpA-OmpF porin